MFYEKASFLSVGESNSFMYYTLFCCAGAGSSFEGSAIWEWEGLQK